MSKQITLFAHASCAALFALVLIIATARDAISQTPTPRPGAAAGPVKSTTNATQTTPANSDAPKQSAPSPALKVKDQALMVREIDETALAKLLRRAPAPSNPDPRTTAAPSGSASTPGPAAATPLLVNFWATWCDPCRAEFPDLVQIDADYRPRGLEFITISLDEVTEIKTTVPEFLQSMRATQIPAYLLHSTNPEAAIFLIDKTWRGELPATFLFDAQGQLVFKHTGRIKPAELREALDKVIKP